MRRTLLNGLYGVVAPDTKTLRRPGVRILSWLSKCINSHATALPQLQW
jgi:hypothetical protein